MEQAMRAYLTLALPLLIPSVVAAQPGVFFQIPGWTQAYGISADGTTVVGHSPAGAVAWNLPTSTQTILGPGVATDVSSDGSIVTGTLPGGSVYRWTQATGESPIGHDSFTTPKISSDGSTIIGSSGGTGQTAFRWRASTGVQLLPLSPNANSAGVYDLSADGSEIVGAISVPPNNTLPVLWHNDLSYSIVQPTPPSLQYGLTAINPAGTVAFGFHIAPGTDAFRWTAQTGMVDLGFPRTGNPVPMPSACTADGDIFIGQTFTNQCFVWRLGTEPRTLDDILTNDFGIDLGNLQIIDAADMTPDGRTIVGIGQDAVTGAFSGWVVNLSRSIPAPSTGLALAAAALFASRRRRA
jgi:uncharacterized membrane protein